VGEAGRGLFRPAQYAS